MAPNTKTKSKKSNAAPKRSAGNGSNTSPEERTMDSSLEKLFIDELKDLYYAEKLLTKALPKMAKAATTEELKEALENHKIETQGQIERLDQIFSILGKKAQSKKCEAMDGLVEEAESVIEDTDEGTHTRDVAIIISAQKAEHYEIAAYGSLATLASTFGMTEVAELLHETLEEEKAADELLTQIAESNVNYEAGQEDEEEEE